MPGPYPKTTNRSNTTCRSTPTTASITAPAAIPEQVRHLARLVADGALPFPDNLPPVQRALLMEEVQRRRRDRLVRHIAQIIADDIASTVGAIPENE